MKIEIELPEGRASIEDGQWTAPEPIRDRILQADFEVGFAWDPIGGQDYARAKAVAERLDGAVTSALEEEPASRAGEVY